MSKDWIMYISENQQMLQTAILSLVFVLLFVAVIEVGLLKRHVKGICKSVKKYFDVILAEEESSKVQQEEEMVSAADVQEMVRKERPEDAAYIQEKNRRKQQEEAKLLMDVIQEVF